MAELIAVAETAQDVGSALHKFLDPVADYSAEITALIAQCFHTSSALRELHDAIQEYRYPRRHQRISEDLTAVKRSLYYTFKDVQSIFGGLGKAGVRSGSEYRRVWRDLVDHFHEESGNTLSRRLRYYQEALHGLTDIVADGEPSEPDEFEDIRDKILSLLEFQDERLADELYKTSLGVPNISKPRSFERNRPKTGQPQVQPQSPPPASLKAGKKKTPGPRSPPMEDDYDPRGDRHPPPAPEVPQSPSTSTSTTFSSTHSSKTPSLPNHWLPIVYEQSQPTTPLETTGQTSVSLGPDLGPEASKRLADGYTKLLEMPFENGDMLVRLYQRPKDYKSRFLCRTIRPARSRKDCCLPLTSLEVERDGPFLKFARISSDGSSKLWACLKFPSYEKLVLFFCSFIALRAEDTSNPLTTIPDSHLHNEVLLFSGKIVDDYYQHGLRLFRDRNSGGIRLQASILNGDLKRAPVWTAFITHQVQSRKWIARPGSYVIHLAELQRYIFNDDYNPQVAATGEHELTFETRNDLKAFILAVEDLLDDE